MSSIYDAWTSPTSPSQASAQTLVPVHSFASSKPDACQPGLCCSFTWTAYVTHPGQGHPPLDNITHPQQELCCSSPPALGAAAAARAGPADSPARPAGPAAAAAVASGGPSPPPPVACSAAAAPPGRAAGGSACPAAAAAPGHACTAMDISVSQLRIAASRSCQQQRCNMRSRQAQVSASQRGLEQCC